MKYALNPIIAKIHLLDREYSLFRDDITHGASHLQVWEIYNGIFEYAKRIVSAFGTAATVTTYPDRFYKAVF